MKTSNLPKPLYFCFFAVLSTLFPRHNLFAQEGNFLFPIETIEQKLLFDEINPIKIASLRTAENITKKVTLEYADGTSFKVKIRRAIAGADAFNNQPRYEVAAYQFQKLLLDPDDYVVPPTVVRALPLSQFARIDRDAVATFDRPGIVLFIMQYWLNHVDHRKVYDKKRLQTDSLYARHAAIANIFAYLINHNDSNEGNFLISKIPESPRIFAVDNGISFASEASDRGYFWRELFIDSAPKRLIDRLRALTLAKLNQELGIVTQLEMTPGQIKNVEPQQNPKPDLGVRRIGNVIQLGLTRKEISDLMSRIEALLRRVDEGRLKAG